MPQIAKPAVTISLGLCPMSLPLLLLDARVGYVNPTSDRSDYTTSQFRTPIGAQGFDYALAIADSQRVTSRAEEASGRIRNVADKGLDSYLAAAFRVLERVRTESTCTVRRSDPVLGDPSAI